MNKALNGVFILTLLITDWRVPDGQSPVRQGLHAQTARATSGATSGATTTPQSPAETLERWVSHGRSSGQTVGRVSNGIGPRQIPSWALQAGFGSKDEGSQQVLPRDGVCPPVSEADSAGSVYSRLSRGGYALSSRSAGVFTVTAYTAGPESTGKGPGEVDYGITATGTKARAHHTIATDWHVLSPGTVVKISGLPGTYTVEDKGAAVTGKHIDLYIPGLTAALEWGVQHRKVTVIEWGPLIDH